MQNKFYNKLIRTKNEKEIATNDNNRTNNKQN